MMNSSPRRYGYGRQRNKLGSLQSTRGFTLIELMITVAIVAILASIAYPSYQDQVRKSRRADAKANLLELAQFMERNFTVTGRYNLNASGNPLTLPWTESPQDSTPKFYTLSLASANQTFTLTATPKNGQENDTVCGVLTIDQAGNKTESGTGSVGDCW